MDWRSRVQALTGCSVLASSRLTGGCIAEVLTVDLEGGRTVVVKSADADGSLDVEGFMLRYLAEHSRLPVPRVLHAERSLLVMEHIEGESRFSDAAERHAARLLAHLHSIRGPAFGFERDTLIGPLPQRNTRCDSWLEFFREHRLMYMAGLARESGYLPESILGRIRRLADNLDRHLQEPDHPSLLHGDVWTTNVLARGDRIAAFLDPAIYWGHPEIELAFATLFGTFGPAFFGEYRRHRPLAPGFFEERRDLYNLYPLLVHTRLFGSGYAQQVASVLGKLGY